MAEDYQSDNQQLNNCNNNNNNDDEKHIFLIFENPVQ